MSEQSAEKEAQDVLGIRPEKIRAIAEQITFRAKVFRQVPSLLSIFPKTKDNPPATCTERQFNGMMRHGWPMRSHSHFSIVWIYGGMHGVNIMGLPF